MNLAIMYFLAECNCDISPHTTAQPAFRVLITDAQEKSCTLLHIFKRNKDSEHKSKRSVLQMIKDVFDEMAATCAEREEGAGTLASAKA